jgi:diguanylate cyclase (GGDEF)-like protein/PAS domain S-box-containing protein
MDQAAATGADSNRFQLLVEHIPGIVVYLDIVQPDDPSCSLPVYISPQVEDILGYERAAWLTDDELWIHILHPADRDRMIEADAAARATLSSLFAEYRMVARDRRIVWVSENAAVVADEATGTLYWQGVMVDITARKRAEEALAESERRHRSVFDAATIGLLTLDLKGHVLEANRAVERVLGHSPGGLAGESLWPADEVPPEVASVCSGLQDRCEVEQLLRRPDGSPLWCRLVLVLVRDGAGDPEQVTAMVEDIDRRKRVEADLVHRSNHDPLTRLPNRQHFLERLREERERATVMDEGVGVVFIDIDNFKNVNDSFGHDAGDGLLTALAERLREAVRPTDLVARFGGDEFLVLAGGLSEARDVAQLAWRLANELRTPFPVGSATVVVTASFGVSYSSDPAESDEHLVRKSDAAMYTAKQRGRNRVAVFGEPASANAVA